MEVFIIILLIALIIAIAVSTNILLSNFKQARQEQLEASKEDKSLLLLQNQISKMNQEIDNKLSSNQRILTDGLQTQTTILQKQSSISTRTIQELQNQSSKTIQEVTEKLTKLDETNKKVVDFATQLQSLENILKNPKQRGILGEYFLETLLSKVMPQGTYKMQYKFSDGEIVDAAIIVKEKIIPIDSKFSLEKYNEIQTEINADTREQLKKEFRSDLKMRIDETSKYIRPQEGTTDFALMFIPAEGIFYDILVQKVGSLDISAEDLITYAFKKRVILVSPNTFFAYLQTILQALKALQVEESIKEVITKIAQMGKHMVNYQDYISKVGKHLGSTVSAYNQANHQFRMIDKDVLKISGEKIGAEEIQLEKPEEN